MVKEKKDFGWPAALRDYSWSSIVEDSIIPLIFSIILLVIMLWLKIDLYKALSSIVNLSLQIVPIMLSLLLAGYAILLTLYATNFMKEIKNMGGTYLFTQINASFAIAIFVMVIGVFVNVTSSFIISLNIKSPSYINEDVINGSLFIIIMFLLVFSIRIIKDVTVNIYNLGKALLKM
ncbi:hypothetical protein [uncultured Bacteroides sp.]|uniref:hypothetical protein n=1 Tax=uncultured Bacteroides sp. TaxID=162156 RepID=UPI002AABC292|nr:hypothetical protein [uncultured Bacteroides sp.]